MKQQAQVATVVVEEENLLEAVLNATALVDQVETPHLNRVLETTSSIRLDWRTLRPTEKQIEALAKLGDRRIPHTRGEASEWISAHGKRIHDERKARYLQQQREREAARPKVAPKRKPQPEPCGCESL